MFLSDLLVKVKIIIILLAIFFMKYLGYEAINKLSDKVKF